MHQPYYRLGRGRPFEMPWVRMHALKDYLDMVLTLADYPSLHQTFNLVPSLVEQLEDYARGDFSDVYWDHTMKPAADLDPAERAFVVERMCERPAHPRARSHPRYLGLAHKRAAQASLGWETCASSFTSGELRDLQVWFNLAWFEPQALKREPLSGLVARGRDFSEDDKQALAQVQGEILARTLPAYRDAARRGQIELSTSPYFHPILPLLANTDSARVSVADALLPSMRFSHPEDVVAQVRMATEKHEAVFGTAPKGMWCSEQAVGEEIIPVLVEAGLSWTISDELVLSRSLSGTVASVNGRAGVENDGLYLPHVLERDSGRLTIIFRDHTLSDLIGFAYQSWDSHDAARDLVQRLHGIRSALLTRSALSSNRGDAAGIPLVTIALDGENAWEYYPHDGRDFLQALYERLSDDPLLRCVTVSEHLAESPGRRALSWLHTGSWIGGDLATWIGDPTHGLAWDALLRARNAAASGAAQQPRAQSDEAWRHIYAAEGSDWFWWFGDHHHTELDYVWDTEFRRHLRECYRVLGQKPPPELSFPLLQEAPSPLCSTPPGPVHPVIDGIIGNGLDGLDNEWAAAGMLAEDVPSTMQRADGTKIREVRFGWHDGDLCILVVPTMAAVLPGLEVEIRLIPREDSEDVVLTMVLEGDGRVRTDCFEGPCEETAANIIAFWEEVLEMVVPMRSIGLESTDFSLILQVGRGGMVEHTFQSASLAPCEEEQHA